MPELNFIPTKDKVVILPEAAETKTAGGIIIPENAQKVPARGTVVAIGPKVDVIKVGDFVLYGQSTGFPIEVDKTTYKMMQENDVLLIRKPGYIAPNNIDYIIRQCIIQLEPGHVLKSIGTTSFFWEDVEVTQNDRENEFLLIKYLISSNHGKVGEEDKEHTIPYTKIISISK